MYVLYDVENKIGIRTTSLESIQKVKETNPLIKEGVKTHLNGEIHFKVLRPDLFNLKTLSDKSEVIAKIIEDIVVTELTGLCKIKIRKNGCKNK